MINLNDHLEENIILSEFDPFNSFFDEYKVLNSNDTSEHYSIHQYKNLDFYNEKNKLLKDDLAMMDEKQFNSNLKIIFNNPGQEEEYSFIHENNSYLKKSDYGKTSRINDNKKKIEDNINENPNQKEKEKENKNNEIEKKNEENTFNEKSKKVLNIEIKKERTIADKKNKNNKIFFNIIKSNSKRKKIYFKFFIYLANQNH